MIQIAVFLLIAWTRINARQNHDIDDCYIDARTFFFCSWSGQPTETAKKTMKMAKGQKIFIHEIMREEERTKPEKLSGHVIVFGVRWGFLSNIVKR